MNTPDSTPASPELSLWHSSAQLQGARALQEDTIAVSERRDGLAVVVADGLGGHPEGEWASRTATSVVMGAPWLNASNESLAGLMKSAIREAHAAVKRQVWRDDQPATTLIAAFMDAESDEITLASVGDSYALLMRDGGLRSLLMTRMPLPEGMYKYDARPRSLAYSVGYNIGVEGVGIEVQKYPLQHGDRLLFATDGIDFIARDRIIHCLALPTPRAAAEALVREFIEAGDEQQDNVSFVVVFVQAVKGVAAATAGDPAAAP